MKKNQLFYIAVFFVASLFGATAQESNIQNSTKLENISIKRISDLISMQMDLNITNLEVSRNQMIVVTPVLTSRDSRNTVRFNPVVIMGAGRDKTLDRAISFEGFSFEKEPQQLVRRKNNTQQTVPLLLETGYANWMSTARLIFEEKHTGCTYADLLEGKYTALASLSPRQEAVEEQPVQEFVPQRISNLQFQLAYGLPPAEEIKQRSETYVAKLNFAENQHTISRNIGNNAAVLNEIAHRVNAIKNDPNVNVINLRVVGYASPDGTEKNNVRLSERRAKAFVDYMRQNHGVNRSEIEAEWRGEDWAGLWDAIYKSDLSNRDAILDQMEERNLAKRKQNLKNMSGGSVYRTLMRDFFPDLRRDEYTITYVARSFSVDEARTLVQTKPQQLSLNEMFLVAGSYDVNSQEYQYIFDLAYRMYPDDPIVLLNCGALEIEEGKFANAGEKLTKADIPEAWNNLGVIHAQQGDYTKALEMFEKAAMSGLHSAISNAAKLKAQLGQ